MARELSTAWWNVIRRKMYATPSKPYPVKCPDCGSPTWLMKGRFGRFYKCQRLDCVGTTGAQLDGRPRKPKVPAALRTARRAARDAVHRIVECRDRLSTGRREWLQAQGESWWNQPHHLVGCRDDFRAVVFSAKLEPIPQRIGLKRLRQRSNFIITTKWLPVGLYIRKRSVEECERIVEAANTHLRLVALPEEMEFRRRRGHAWDRVLLGSFGEEEPAPPTHFHGTEYESADCPICRPPELPLSFQSFYDV